MVVVMMRVTRWKMVSMCVCLMFVCVLLFVRHVFVYMYSFLLDIVLYG